jgi:hypothetical protein
MQPDTILMTDTTTPDQCPVCDGLHDGECFTAPSRWGFYTPAGVFAPIPEGPLLAADPNRRPPFDIVPEGRGEVRHIIYEPPVPSDG